MSMTTTPGGYSFADAQAQFAAAVGRYPAANEEADVARAWDSKSYDDFRAWVKANFSRDTAPATAAVPAAAPSRRSLWWILGGLAVIGGGYGFVLWRRKHHHA